ncbi:MAG: hypothetical protein HJJLKODD_02367 [Phycisphaerae bacterium]|nr:hypothetical protein [Phycisphaerae bacterium]
MSPIRVPAAYQQQLEAMSRVIAQLTPEQQDQLQPLLAETISRQEQIARDCYRARDILANLTLYVKYLIFSAEARHRETQGR